MSSKRNKVCTGCKARFRSNKELCNHMQNSTKPECSKDLQRCSGCNGLFATVTHLQNHQSQGCQETFWCYPVEEQTDIVSTLGLSNLKASSCLFSNDDFGLKRKNNGMSDIPTFNIAIEQKRPKTEQSAESVYGLVNTSLNHISNDYCMKFGDQKNNHSLDRTKTESLKTTTSHELTGKNHSFLMNSKLSQQVAASEHQSVVDKQSFIYESIMEKIRNGNEYMDPKEVVYDAKVSDGNTYSLIVDEEENLMQINDDEVHDVTDEYNEYSPTFLERNLEVPDTFVQEMQRSHSEQVDNNNNNNPAVDEILILEDDQSDAYSIVDDDIDYLANFHYFADVDDVDDSRDRNVNDNIDNNSANAFSNFGEHSVYVRKRSDELFTHRQGIIWTEMDLPLIDLYHIHRKCRAPIGLFDETLKWLEKHSSALFDQEKKSIKHIPKRKAFVNAMYKKVYGEKNVDEVKPKLIKVDIPLHSTSINATMFDFREVLADMLSNEDIMNPDVLQFYDNSDPTRIHPIGEPFSNVITSDVFRRAHRRLCTGPNDVLWPLVVYNDEINFDSQGKLKLDPLQLSFLRLPQYIRNQPFAWRTFGIVHNLESRMFPKKLKSAEKLQVQHNVLEKLYKMVEILQEEGGIPWKLKLKNGSHRDVVLKVYIQMIIGDTKGHDQHCGRMGAHSTGMKQCVRDCNVSMDRCDKPDHRCTFRKVSDFSNLDVEGCNQLSFHKIDNCYSRQDMGDEIHGIFGATPGEPLHVLDSGLCPLVSDVVKDDLSSKAYEELEKAVMNIVSVVQRQSSAKYMPSIHAFRNGLIKISSLTGKEKAARLFAMFLALMQSDCCKALATRTQKGVGNHREYGEKRVQEWLSLFERTLCFRMWLKEDLIPSDQLYSEQWANEWKDCFDNNEMNLPTEDDHMVMGSLAQRKIIEFMKEYHRLIKGREGNGLQIPKFHLCLHFTRNICRHGPVSCYDGARPEANAKELAKCPGLRTQKHHKSISFQTALRYHEDLTMIEAERLMMMHCPHLNSSFRYFNKKKEDKNMPSVCINDAGTKMKFSTKNSSRFSIRYVENRIQNDTMKTYKVEWESKSIQPTARINDDMLQCLAFWLFIDPRGGRISKDSICNCFTETQIQGITYRAHPFYRSEDAWYDWVYVKWDGYDEPIPARVYLFFHLEGCDFETEDEVREDHGLSRRFTHEALTTNNTKDFIQAYTYWAVVHSAVDCELQKTNYPSKYHLKSNIAKRIQMEDKKFRIVPLNSIVGPCYGILNHSNPNSEFDNTAIIVKPPHTWAETFITNN